MRLVERVLSSRSCLIVTGYQDFLSALTIILDSAGDLETREPGSIRVIFGANFETSRTMDMMQDATLPVSQLAERMGLS